MQNKRISKVYTQRDLLNVKSEYQKNYTLLLQSVGTSNHDFYAAEEHRLHSKETKIRANLAPDVSKIVKE